MAKKNKNEENLEESVVTSIDQLGQYLEETKNFHYNLEDETDLDEAISSGSLIFDVKMDGGYRPGILRLSGISEGGKTHIALSFMKNFLANTVKRKGIYIKSEGRLAKQVQDRSGIKFVHKSEEWVEGTCFIFKTNCYETAITLMRNLVKNNDEKIKYFFILDSMDALIPQGDYDKGAEEANKVAAAALLSSDFLRRISLGLSERGHRCIMISQVRSKVSINPYEKTDPKLTNASGGNAALHYSDWILEVQPRYTDDIISTEAKGKGDVLGHFCKVIFRKSPNEKSGEMIRYPIKYGQTNGNSVWLSYEIVDLLLAFEGIKKNGAWFEFSEREIEEQKKINIEIPTRVQGLAKLREIFDNNIDLVKYYQNKFRSKLTNGLI